MTQAAKILHSTKRRDPPTNKKHRRVTLIIDQYIGHFCSLTITQFQLSNDRLSVCRHCLPSMLARSRGEKCARGRTIWRKRQERKIKRNGRASRPVFINGTSLNGPFINPRCACAARVTVVLRVCVCVCLLPLQLILRWFVRRRNDTTYSAGNENQFNQ